MTGCKSTHMPFETMKKERPPQDGPSLNVREQFTLFEMLSDRIDILLYKISEIEDRQIRALDIVKIELTHMRDYIDKYLD